ncbi:hypothetical protein [Mammaliicoccus lentus]|uniref:hypothetical protein n=1 Tax=Mammaliicoccus lentus TaxID=42858 RepID=UPI003A5988C0
MKIETKKLNFIFSLVSAKKNEDKYIKIRVKKYLLSILTRENINNKKPSKTKSQKDNFDFKNLIAHTPYICIIKI